MPLHALQAPVPAERCVRAALRTPLPRLPHEPPGDRSTLRPVLSLPMHRLDTVVAPDGEPRTELTGWRFLLSRGERAVTAAEAGLTTDGWAFSHFCGGPYIASIEQALRQADGMATAYQPRLLSVDQLYMLTLWLHTDIAAPPEAGRPGTADLLVPLAPAPPGIAPDLPMAMSGLLRLLSSRLPAAPLAG